MKGPKFILMGITFLTTAVCYAGPDVKKIEWYMQHHDEVLMKYEKCRKLMKRGSLPDTNEGQDCLNVLIASQGIKDPDFHKSLNKKIEWYIQHHDEVLMKYEKFMKLMKQGYLPDTNEGLDCENVLIASQEIKDPGFHKSLNKKIEWYIQHHDEDY